MHKQLNVDPFFSYEPQPVSSPLSAAIKLNAQ